MKLVTHKCVCSCLFLTSRLKLRFKSSAKNWKLLEIMAEMPHNTNLLFTDKIDASVGFIGLEILGNTSGASPCGVSLNTGTRSYLFNCGEGLQKVLSEYKIKPSKYRHIFITYPSWKNIGGIIGTALSMQESNVKFLNIHGHSCLEDLYDALKYIVNMKGIQQSVREWQHNSKYLDDFIKVKFVHLHHSDSLNLNKSRPLPPLDQFDKAETSGIKKENDLTNNEHLSDSSNSKHENTDSDSVKQTRADGNRLKNSPTFAMSFIIRTQKSYGSLNFEKCMDLGVPVGPLLGQLKRGQNVRLSNGKIVKSSDVKDPDLPGVIVIVVECPTEDYLDSLLQEPAFFKHQLGQKKYYSSAVVHFSKSNIIKNEKYQEWISRFSEETIHIFVNEESEIGAFVGLHRHQFKLNMVHPEIFPSIHTFGIPEFSRAERDDPKEGDLVADVPVHAHDKNSPAQIHSDKVYYRFKNNFHILGETLCEIYLKTKRKFDYSKCLVLKKHEYMQEMLAIPNFERKLEELKKKIASIESIPQLEKKIYPKIVFLGTGSKKPSKTRNASGILVFLSEDKSIILDCGESIYCQLLIFFGEEKTKEVLRNLSAVFISHLHIDHHLGLPSLLINRKNAIDELNNSESESNSSGKAKNKPFTPLNVIAPVQILPFLHYLSRDVFDFSNLYKVIPCGQFASPNHSQEENIKQFISDLNLESLETVSVDHAPHSFGVALKHKDGWKLTYSGDTRPCDNLIKIGQDSDVLIHEATFDDFYVREAREKLHSTTDQAILVGRKMNAKFILLTHFSQRYSHLPVIKDELLSKQDVGVAFDFMQVSPYQFPILPYLYEPLQLVFSAYQEQMEQREELLKIKRDRENFATRPSEENERPMKIPKIKNL